MTLSVTQHAIDQFRLRGGGGKEWDDAKIAAYLFRIADRGQPMRVKERFRVLQLLNHGVRDAEYFRLAGWMVVVEDGVIKTVHQGTAERWEPITK